MSVSYERRPVPHSSVPKLGGSSSLADVLNVVLDKGIVIDAWVRVSAVGIELLTIEARVVVASVETYLRYAEAIGLTGLAAAPGGGRQGNGKPSEDDVLDYLSDHPEGLRLGEMEAYFNAPRRQLSEVVSQLVEDDQVHRDDETRLYFAADSNGTNKQGDEDERE